MATCGRIIQPVVRLEGKLCIFPGIPGLFQQMIDGLVPYLPLPPPNARPFRHLIHTKSAPLSSVCSDDKSLILRYRLPESSIAPYLTSLHERLKNEGIRVGSYPLLMQGVTVSLIGFNQERVREIGKEVRIWVPGLAAQLLTTNCA